MRSISKEEFYNYYIRDNHSHAETKEHFGLNNYSLLKLLKQFGLNKKDNLEDVKNRVDRDELYQFYSVEHHTMDECLKHFNIKLKQLYFLLNTYGFDSTTHRHSYVENIPYEDFYKYYITDKHTVAETLKHFNITISDLNRLKARTNINDKLRYNISKEDLYDYYIEGNHTYQETIKHFNISMGVLNRKLKKYGIKKPQYLVNERTEATCNERYGVPYHCMTEECKSKSSKSNSKPNNIFREKLVSNIPDFNPEYGEGIEFNIGKKSFDFKVGNKLVELNPTITHNININPFGENKPIDKYYHRDKSKLAEDNGYECIHIWDWDDQDKIINLLKPRPTIGARKCIIKNVPLQEAIDFINKYHLQNYTKDNIRIGLYYNNELVSIMTFGKPRYNKRYEYELLRYCSSYKIVGGAEKIFKYFINNYSPKSIISYCDRSKFKGTTYTKLGFKLLRNNQPSCHWYGPNVKRHITNNLLNHRGVDQLFGTNYGKGTYNKELMLKHWFFQVYDCGQATYVWEDINANKSEVTP